ncbi:hypothetical protein C1645_788232 [Glomus cerebriforme]|uniref:Uncharacterized protein n=1 Tax=Glomus cerebriforme TaxID=658196 RepID=A0A397SEV0_9GLOM|nr:hypothetical protein C1645_788232 [Glomus cerebriforme]
MTEISSSKINVKNNSEDEYTKLYDPKVVEWLTRDGGDIYNKDINNINKENTYNNDSNDSIPTIPFSNKQYINEQKKGSLPSPPPPSSSKETDSKEEEIFQERIFVEGPYKENPSQEEYFIQGDYFREIKKNFRVSSSRGSTSSTGTPPTPPSPYSAELVQTPDESINSMNIKENETLSPIKPLKAKTTTTISTLKRTSNINDDRISCVYEILQEIKPDHPIQIHNNFAFMTDNKRPSSISHNPLLHHHRNSIIHSRNSSSSRSGSFRNSVNYTPPRRYSNIKRSYYDIEFDKNNNFNNFNNLSKISNYNSHSIYLAQEKKKKNNNNINNNINNIIYEDKNKMYGKYFFWFGFLFLPMWWFGSIHRPNSTEDYKWRQRCRKASIWSFVTLVFSILIGIIVIQRVKFGY